MKVAGIAPATFAETALVLAQRGWRPIPLVAATKQPAEPGWNARNETPWPPGELEQVVIRYGNEACGIALQREVLAVDVDILDPERSADVSRLADSHLGDSPLRRIGMTPKFVAIYRAAEPLTSTKPHPIELYSDTGQVAVFGWHAKAGKPYTWPGLSPLEVAVDSTDIPAVTQSQLRQFLRAVQPILADIRREARQRHGGSAGVGQDAGEYLRSLMARGLSHRHASRRVLEGAGEFGRHYAVRAVIASGYNHGLTADAIWALLERFAPADLLAHVAEDDYVRRTLRDFAPRQSGRVVL